MKQVLVDASSCIGCQICEQIAPASFKINDEGVSAAINPPGDSEETVEQALSSCPVSCISWLEE